MTVIAPYQRHWASQLQPLITDAALPPTASLGRGRLLPGASIRIPGPSREGLRHLTATSTEAHLHRYTSPYPPAPRKREICGDTNTARQARRVNYNTSSASASCLSGQVCLFMHYIMCRARCSAMRLQGSTAWQQCRCKQTPLLSTVAGHVSEGQLQITIDAYHKAQ
jgi:hypothetical protein